MTSQPRVAIVGGSLVGPATELMFRAAGFTDVTTYEANRNAHVQSGGVMGLRPESLNILRSAGVPTEKLVAIDARDVVAHDLTDDGGWRFRRHDVFPGDTTSWDALHNTLADMSQGVKYGWRVESFDENGLHFTNGETVEADIVVFADGRKSKGREMLDPDRKLCYQGYMVWRGLVPPPDMNVQGFHRYYDDAHGILFSLTEPIKQSGLSYWEFSHNLAAGTYTRFAGRPPEERAFLLPSSVTGKARTIMGAFAETHLPEAFAEIVTGTEQVMGIPINDTYTPTFNHKKVGNAYGILIGDALAAVRLQAGAGLNNGLSQASELVKGLSNTDNVGEMLEHHENWSLETLLPWLELGKVRAHRSQLGVYNPTKPGYTVPSLATTGNVWDTPQWIKEN